MNPNKPLAFDTEVSELPTDAKARHEAIVDCFGRFIFWLRNSAIRSSKKFIASAEARGSLGTIRRRPYEGVAGFDGPERDAAMALAVETLDAFAERLMWMLGDEGTDSRFGTRHAYRFRIQMEIVDVETGQVVGDEAVNRGGKFFGSYWGRWLNRYGSEQGAVETDSSR